MRSLLASVLVASVSAAASGQAHQPGAYDGRNIAGWTYSEQGSQAAGLPSWYRSDGSSEQDGANCNVGTSPVNGTAADWHQYFSSVTPASFAAQLRQSGTAGARGYLTDVMQRSDRPIMRNLLSAQAAGQTLEFMIVSVSGGDRMVTITCTVMSGHLLERIEAFDSFADNLVIEIAPPR